MSWEQDQKLKALEEERNRLDQASALVGAKCNEAYAYRPSLRERVEKQYAHARESQRKSDRLAELLSLLDKHPDVARILDLVEEIHAS